MSDPRQSAVKRIQFTVLLSAAMAAATFAGPAFAVLARFIIDDLGLSRAELGWVVAAFSVVGALASPAIGRLTDRVGGRKALAGWVRGVALPVSNSRVYKSACSWQAYSCLRARWRGDGERRLPSPVVFHFSSSPRSDRSFRRIRRRRRNPHHRQESCGRSRSCGSRAMGFSWVWPAAR